MVSQFPSLEGIKGWVINPKKVIANHHAKNNPI